VAQRTSYAQGTPSWIDLLTPDQAASKSFYGALFGWSFDDQQLGDGVYYSIAMLGDDRVAAIAPPNPDSAGTPPRWTTYLTVDDVDAAAGRAAAAGGSVAMPAMDVMGAGRMAMVADPSGAVVALWQAKDIAGAGRVNEPGTLIWNELITDDAASALPFYEAVAGMTTSSMDMGEAGSYTLFEADGKQVGGTMAPMMDGVPNYWHVYFAVADVDATAAKATAAGGTVVGEPFDSPVGRMAILQDPHGAMFSVMAPAGD
jgi:hypothetical protein